MSRAPSRSAPQIVLPEGTALYVSRCTPYPIYLLPETVYPQDVLYLAYDLRHQGEVVLPRGTQMTGTWIAEQAPELSAQLQIISLSLRDREYPCFADSDVFLEKTQLNGAEVEYVPFLEEKIQGRKGPARRRVVRYRNQDYALMDNHLDTIYLRVRTELVRVRLIRDLSLPARIDLQ